jgi:hypothetical protein
METEMEHQDNPRLIHHYDRNHARILCGVEDRTAHWTTRRSVSCARCSEMLRAGERPASSSTEPVHAADAH